MPRQPYYAADGEPVTGVTTILSVVAAFDNGLMTWANRLGKDGKDYYAEMEHLAAVGTMCHALVEARLTNKKTQPDPDLDVEDIAAAINGYRGFLTWSRQTALQVVDVESLVVHEQLRYGGTADIVARDSSGEHIVIDVKTSGRVYDKHKLQVEAYRRAWNASRPDQLATRTAILRVDKRTAGYEYIEYKGAKLDYFWAQFLALRALYEKRRIIRGRRKTNMEALGACLPALEAAVQRVVLTGAAIRRDEK